ACDPHLLDLQQDDVAVAVDARAAHVLDVPGRVALAPVLLTAARPVGGAAFGQRAAQGLVVHPREHQHLTGGGFLHDGGCEAARAEAHARDPQGEIEIGRLTHRIGIPSSRMADLTSSIVIWPVWNTVAASTASAPAWMAGAKCPTSPAPP